MREKTFHFVLIGNGFSIGNTFVQYVLFVLLPRHEAVATGFVAFEVSTAEEWLHLAFFNNQVAVLAFVALKD